VSAIEQAKAALSLEERQIAFFPQNIMPSPLEEPEYVVMVFERGVHDEPEIVADPFIMARRGIGPDRRVARRGAEIAAKAMAKDLGGTAERTYVNWIRRYHVPNRRTKRQVWLVTAPAEQPEKA
jgi:hypothetical protein